MSDDNYVSPYGFSPLTDAALDQIAGRNELTSDQFADIVANIGSEEVDNIIDNWWKNSMRYAMDQLNDAFYPYLPEEDNNVD